MLQPGSNPKLINEQSKLESKYPTINIFNQTSIVN